MKDIRYSNLQNTFKRWICLSG